MARHEIATLIGLLICRLDARAAGNGRRAGQHQFSIVKRGASALRQQDRVAFRPGRRRRTVHLVAQHYSNRPRRQPGWGVGARYRYMTAGEPLVHSRVVAIARARVLYLMAQRRRVADHRRESILGKRLPHTEGRL